MSDNPLFLPTGSIRAIIAILTIAGAFAYFLIYKAFPAELVGIVSVVITAYFTTRGKDDNTSFALKNNNQNSKKGE